MLTPSIPNLYSDTDDMGERMKMIVIIIVPIPRRGGGGDNEHGREEEEVIYHGGWDGYDMPKEGEGKLL